MRKKTKMINKLKNNKEQYKNLTKYKAKKNKMKNKIYLRQYLNIQFKKKVLKRRKHLKTNTHLNKYHKLVQIFMTKSKR